MAGQLADSMKADAQKEDDLPTVAESKTTYGAKRTPIVGSSDPAVGGTYRPSYVPPTPAAPIQKKQVIKVDTSGVSAGTIVKHKAFGMGEVKGIDGSRIVVSFQGKDKTFQFPGAFEQGFLSLDE